MGAHAHLPCSCRMQGYMEPPTREHISLNTQIDMRTSWASSEGDSHRGGLRNAGRWVQQSFMKSLLINSTETRRYGIRHSQAAEGIFVVKQRCLISHLPIHSTAQTQMQMVKPIAPHFQYDRTASLHLIASVGNSILHARQTPRIRLCQAHTW